MTKEIEMTFQFTTAEDRARGRSELKHAMLHYEDKNDCTLVVKSSSAKHYEAKFNVSDFWVETTICEVFNVVTPLKQ